MSRDLPPLSALRVFEAAARHLSFTRAAAELGMTQAAVSYQVKLLEDRIGSPLFLRGRRQLALTEAGAILAGPASEALDLLASSYAVARGHDSGKLTLSVMPSFGTWLARHLEEFQTRHPHISVDVISSDVVVDFDKEEVDLAVRMGSGTWPGLTSHRLLDVTFTPMLSQDLLRRLGGLEAPKDLLRAPLLSPSHSWWCEWFKGAGIERDVTPGRAAASLGAQPLRAVAAMSGHGVALLTPSLWLAELADGRLVQPFDHVGRNGSAYWLCYLPGRRNLPKISLFRSWLLGCFPQQWTEPTRSSEASP